jgi:hypothetical protein
VEGRVEQGWQGKQTGDGGVLYYAGHWLEMADSIASPKPRKYEGSNESDWMIYFGPEGKQPKGVGLAWTTTTDA